MYNIKLLFASLLLAPVVFLFSCKKTGDSANIEGVAYQTSNKTGFVVKPKDANILFSLAVEGDVNKKCWYTKTLSKNEFDKYKNFEDLKRNILATASNLNIYPLDNKNVRENLQQSLKEVKNALPSDITMSVADKILGGQLDVEQLRNLQLKKDLIGCATGLAGTVSAGVVPPVGIASANVAGVLCMSLLAEVGNELRIGAVEQALAGGQSHDAIAKQEITDEVKSLPEDNAFVQKLMIKSIIYAGVLDLKNINSNKMSASINIEPCKSAATLFIEK